ncbi:MAG: hypothetical protein II129_01560 [Paludibacteraceae bacterium]|nr:hypothetical protein [Paludibacteraceae bacterium]
MKKNEKEFILFGFGAIRSLSEAEMRMEHWLGASATLGWFAHFGYAQ